VIAVVFTPLEDLLGAFERLGEGRDVALTRANVEGDADNVETEVLCDGEETTNVVEGSAELGREAADGVGVVGDDAEHQLGVGVNLLDLVELKLIVEGHKINIVLGSEGDHALCLAAVSVDDVGWLRAGKSENHLDLTSGSAVEFDSHRCEGSQNDGIRVALHGVERLYAREIVLP